MIAAATQDTQGHFSIVNAINNLPFSWFDVALVVVLAFGLYRGRKNGMTKEIIPFFEWLAVILAAGFSYAVAAQIFINALSWGVTISFVLGYLTVAMLVFFVFLIPRKFLGPRLEGSNVFGGGEYYLGMMAGLLRYACVVVFVLALLNAPVYTAADIAATNAYNNRWFGGGEKGYSGNFFPNLQQVQASVFKSSLTGPFVKNNLGMLLIDTGQGQPAAAPAQAKKPAITFH